MKNRKPKWYILLPIILILFASFSIVSYKILETRSKIHPENESADYDVEEVYKAFIEEEEYLPKELRKIEKIETEFSAWIAYWDFYTALDSYKSNKTAFRSLSPTWYFLQADGSLGLKNTARNSELINLCKQNRTQLIPSISNSSADELSKILNDKNLLDKHISNIAAEVSTYNFDGIDIDYESIKADDRDKFSTFIRLLSEELHKDAKILTIAVLWKNDLEGIIESVSESRGAQDWSEIGKYVDEFRIMAYDYTGSQDYPGPIAPKDWIRSILDYAQEKIDSHDKIVLGLPLYAYKWVVETKGANALVWTDVNHIATANKSQITKHEMDTEYFEKSLSYVANDQTWVIWYQDSEVTQKRIELAETYGVKKFIFWRLGGEDSGMYDLFDNE
ncbi:MAG: glycosyl hydrolase family 18 protein [Candidatus Dojkabacteria bacterium]|nr:glycosyl hydrolase family 18 protein [Candidatus Dojkabacteria bacterium]